MTPPERMDPNLERLEPLVKFERADGTWGELTIDKDATIQELFAYLLGETNPPWEPWACELVLVARIAHAADAP